LDCEQTNCEADKANPVVFVHALFKAIVKVDPSSSIVAHSSSAVLDKETNFSKCTTSDASELHTFISQFYDGLRVTQDNSMMMRIKVRTNCTFLELIRHTDISTFRHGAWSGRKTSRVIVYLHSLPAAVRFQAGVFYNTDTRSDLAESMGQQINGWAAPGSLPLFQLEVQELWRSDKRILVYRVMTARGDVAKFNEAILPLFPTHTEHLSYLPQKAWGELNSSEKTALLLSQFDFQEEHSTLLFHGVKDASAEITVEPNSTESLSVRQWLMSLKHGSTQLFVRVSSPGPSAPIELVSTIANCRAAKRWLSTALLQVGLRAAPASFSQIFTNPAKARKLLQSSNRPNSTSATTSASPDQDGSACSSGRSATGVEDVLLHSYVSFARSPQKHRPSNRDAVRPPRRDRHHSGFVYELNAASVSGSLPSGTNPVPTATAKSPKKRKPRPTRKTKPTPTPPSAPSAPPPAEFNSPASPASATDGMDSGKDDAASTLSKKSKSSYASVTATTAPLPATASNSADSEKVIAALKKENANFKKKNESSQKMIAELRQQLKQSARTARSPSPVPAAVDPKGFYLVSTKSPSPRRSITTTHSPTPTRESGPVTKKSRTREAEICETSISSHGSVVDPSVADDEVSIATPPQTVSIAAPTSTSNRFDALADSVDEDVEDPVDPVDQITAPLNSMALQPISPSPPCVPGKGL
jgi:hypothetical protein